jgi:MreB/Mbl protein
VGNTYSFGLRRRQYSRRVSSRAGLRGKSRSFPPLPATTQMIIRLAIDVADFKTREFGAPHAERTAERIKIEIGSAYSLDEPLSMEIKGRSLIEGTPKMITADDGEIREAISEGVSTIVSVIRAALERTPGSFPLTSATAASYSPEAVPYSRTWASESGKKPGCRYASPITAVQRGARHR